MTTNPKDIKTQALGMLARLLTKQADQLRAIDPRLLTYYQGLLDPSLHNVYELLGAIKFLRILRTYPFKQKKVTMAIRLYEGQWRDGEYVEGSGGFQFSGLRGFTHYQMQPWQVFATAGLMGPHRDVDGDTRRLCTELVLFLTRKSGKTQFAAFTMALGFFFFDANFEGYCCANSQEQSLLLYKTAQALVRQMDTQERRIRFTARQTNWKVGQPRQASFTALSAGGKTKDGLFAQLCCADEFGSADFTNGKSDMLDLVNVVQSSMGPRREPLTVITTTAGYAVNGPFRNQLDIMQSLLETELTYPDDYATPIPSDYQHALLLQPDPWEQMDEEALLSDEKIWRKANPMIGVSVQPSFYEQEAFKARQNPDNRKEFITKLVNVYQSAVVTEWIKPELIRSWQDRLQREIAAGEKYASRIDQCTADKGWVVFCGMDFSMGDDLYAHGYLGVNTQTGDLLADMDAWITGETLEKISIRPLYEQWIQEGWLHVCPGAIIPTGVPVRRIFDLAGYDEATRAFTRIGCDFWRIGYDPYRAPDPVNMLKAWVQSLDQDPDVHVIPISQTNATYNQPVEQLTAILRHPQGMLRFSPNPLWPYCFGCAVLDKDTRMENKKPVKRNPGSDACKVDPIQALLSAWICWNQVESTQNPQ